MIDRRNNGATNAAAVIVGAFAVIAAAFAAVWFFGLGRIIFEATRAEFDMAATAIPFDTGPVSDDGGPEPFRVVHVPTPEAVKAIYITACTASEKKLRSKAVELFDGTELNSIVIDLKDYTGTISYASTSVAVPARGRGCRIRDLMEFIGELHDRGIYVIARISVFQDPLYAEAFPEYAVRSKSDPEKIWRDRNGLAFIEAGAEPYWKYIVDVSKEAYEIGFDELNYDYIRYPSDGNMKDVLYNWNAGRSRSEVLSAFFAYLRNELGDIGAPLSADFFGLTTTASDDLGIGQILEDALLYFDYVAPMVYPSHFAKGYNGIANPADSPYEVIKDSMTRAAERAVSASTTPEKLRPWLQDFNLGAMYTPEMVREQIQAAYDSGLSSWMLWNAGSTYQKEAFIPVEKEVASEDVI